MKTDTGWVPHDRIEEARESIINQSIESIKLEAISKGENLDDYDWDLLKNDLTYWLNNRKIDDDEFKFRPEQYLVST